MYNEESSDESDLDWPRVRKRKRSSVAKKRVRISPSALQRLGETLKDQASFPVMCGDKQGVLHKAKYIKKEQCILSGDSWFTPTEFERFGGKEKNKKWKTSIYHSNIPLQTFIHHRFLSSPSFKTKRLQDKERVINPRRSSGHIQNYRTFPSHSSLGSHSSADDSEYYDNDANDNDDDDDDDGNEDVVNDDANYQPYEEDDGDDNDDDDDDGNEDVVSDIDLVSDLTDDDDNDDHDDGDDDGDDDGNEDVVNDDANNEADEEEEDDGSFKVTCSSGKGVLHKSRFATETCGKCIRTQDAWLTPKDFLERNKTDGNWRRDIRRRDKPLGELIMSGELELHSVNCKCPICTRELLHELDEKNDDLCYKCNHDGDLVCCNKCPRAFHHHCHNPQLLENMISEHWTCSYCQTSDPAARSLSS